MKKFKYLHLMENDKFVQPYIDFIQKNFAFENHFFYIIGGTTYLDICKNEYIFYKNIDIKNKYFKKIYELFQYPKLIIYLMKSEKIFLHGLFNPLTIIILFLNFWTLKKSYWIVWGGDLYGFINSKKHTFISKKFSKVEKIVKGNMKGYITHVKGDYDLIKKYFGAKGDYYNCFMYTSNLYRKKLNLNFIKKELYIQIGNSGSISNNHLEILNKLEKYKNENIKIFCPLSYGNKIWAEKVIKYGENTFGKKFIPITDFMKFEDYMQFLARIDIAIFAHDRQQAVGNITSLLGMEKTVYLKKEVTTYSMLKDLGVKVGDFSELDNLNLFSQEDRRKNKEIIKRRFSKKRLKEDWKKIFGD